MKSIYMLNLVFSVSLSFGVLFAGEKPNIMFLLVDDMGLMDTSIPFLADKSGNQVKHPLNNWYRNSSMTELAEKGPRFTTYRNGEWKLIFHYFPEADNPQKKYLIFNLKEDPDESVDLSLKNPEELNRMVGEMIQELKEKKVLYPEKDGLFITSFSVKD